jgi:hypothetical protein
VLGGTAGWASHCGGETLPFLDDAGVYHAADGAVVFVPGSACAGFDASHIADPAPACDISPDAALDDQNTSIACEGWPSVPPGFPIDVSGCVPDFSNGPPDAGHCVSEGDQALFARCPSIDAVGDMYCQAWAQQFVVTGKAVATCGYGNTAVFGLQLVCNYAGPQTVQQCIGTMMDVTGTDAAPDPVTGVVCRRPCEP